MAKILSGRKMGFILNAAVLAVVFGGENERLCQPIITQKAVEHA